MKGTTNIMVKNNCLYLTSDHNGNAGRAYITRFLNKHRPELNVVDLGPDYGSKVDYVDYAEKLCRLIGVNQGARGILLCGTGTGMAIVANRFPWIRAGLATDIATAELMRQHNDANVLVLGQWRNPLGSMGDLITAFLDTEFEAGRHVSRIEKITKLVP
jgi:ribose 5-phosphate isomerase B